MDPQRAAWLAKYAREPRPWSGTVHAASLLATLSGRVLELGAGGGKVGPELPPDSIALDWAALPPGRAGVLGDVRALPIRPRSVDAVVAIHVLGHLDAPGRQAALAECARVLRPGGVLVLEVFAHGDARDVPGHDAEREGIATHYFGEAEVAELMARAGFRGDITLEERRQRWGARRVIRAYASAIC